MKKSSLSIGVLIATTYLLLSIASTACAADAGHRHPSGHHHGNNVSHSSACAWACQANPSAGFIASGLPPEPVFELLAFHRQQEVGIDFPADRFFVSRGPPFALILL